MLAAKHGIVGLSKVIGRSKPPEGVTVMRSAGLGADTAVPSQIEAPPDGTPDGRAAQERIGAEKQPDAAILHAGTQVASVHLPATPPRPARVRPTRSTAADHGVSPNKPSSLSARLEGEGDFMTKSRKNRRRRRRRRGAETQACGKKVLNRPQARRAHGAFTGACWIICCPLTASISRGFRAHLPAR